jgi:hypothetical protein
MSDLNDLIHTNAHNAYAIGVRTERERIIKLLEQDTCGDWTSQVPYCCDGACRAYNDAINLIKGGQK